MFLRLFLLMSVIPILEIMFLLRVHGTLSSFMGGGQALFITIGSIVLTGMIGARLAQSQRLASPAKIQTQTGQGKVPSNELIEGVMILIGGVLLLTPGYFTDFFWIESPATGNKIPIPEDHTKMVRKENRVGASQCVFYSAGGMGGGFYGSSRPGSTDPFQRQRRKIPAELR